MTTLHFRIHVFLIASLLSLGTFTPTVSGQVFAPQDDQRTGQFIDPSRTLRQILRDAEQASTEKRWGDVVLALGELLARPSGLDPDDLLGGEDFFLDASTSEGLRKESVRHKAESLLGSLPAEGLQIYRLRYGPEATRMLETATTNHDWNLLGDISRRYLHTEAGYDATVLLAGREISRGQPRAGALLLQRLNDHAASRDQLGKPLTDLLQLAWSLAGQSERAEALGGPITGDAAKASSSWMLRDVQSGTIVNGGNAARTGEGGGELPIMHHRWKSHLTNSVQEAKTLEDLKQLRRGSAEFPVPTWQPLVAGKYLLARTTERLVGFDRNDGLLVWHYPWGDIEPSEDPGAETLSDAAGEGAESLLNDRVWHDVPYGRVTSDGRRVFLLDDLAPLEKTSIGNLGGLGGLRQGIRPRETDTSTLVAVDLETEGKLLWSINGRETEEPGLQGAFFLGAPLPVDGRLYVIFEVGGDTYLACLRAEDGGFLWRQHLTTSDVGGGNVEPWKRTVGAVPSLADGVLVCPTAQGVVVAVNLVTRSVRWGIALQRVRTPGGYGNQPFLRQNAYEPVENMERWLDGTAVLSNGIALVPLPECEELVGIDLVTGEMRWPKMPRSDWRYIAGVRDGKFILMGSQELMAFHVATNSKAWSREVKLPQGQRIAGRAVFGKDSIIVPTTGGFMLRYALSDGQLLGSVHVDYPTGNLLVADGTLFSQGITEIGAAYLGGFSLDRMIESRLAVNPKDVWALTRQSEAFIEAGKLREAVDKLQAARAQQPDDEELRVLLVEAMLGLVRQDPKSIEEWSSLLEKLAELPDEKIELQRVLAEGAIRQGKRREAIERLVLLAKLTSENANRQAANADARVPVGKRSVALDDWIAARVSELTRGRTSEEIEAIEAPVLELLKSFDQPTNPLRERLLRQFGTLSAGIDLRMKLTQQLIIDREFMKAERLIFEALDQSPSLADQRPWNLLLTRLYAEAGWVQDAALALAKGEKDGPEATAEELGGISREDLTEKLLVNTEESFWRVWPQYFSAETRSQEIPSVNEMRYVRISSRRGLQWEGWQIGDSGTGEIRLVDPTGSAAAAYHLSSNARSRVQILECVIDGGLLLVTTPSELIAIDLFQINVSNDLLWRYTLGSDGSSIASPPRPEAVLVGKSDNEALDASNQPQMRMAHPLSRRALIFSGGRFVCLNLIDGSELWSSSFSDPAYSGLKQPRNVYVTAVPHAFAIIASENSNAYFVDPFDGTVLEEPQRDAKQQVLRTQGANVLWVRAAANNNGQPLTVGIDDLVTGKTIRETPCDKWASIDMRWQLLVSQSGKVQIWDLRDASLLADTEFEIQRKIDSVSLAQHHDRLIVMTNLVPEATKEIRVTGAESYGPMLAVSIDEGKTLWSTEMDEPYGCRLEQPTGWPLFIFSREAGNATEAQRRVTEYRAVDIRTGKVVDTRQSQSGRISNVPSIVIETQEQKAMVRVGKIGVEYTFSVEPPAKTSKPAPEPEPEVDPFGLFNALESKK